MTEILPNRHTVYLEGLDLAGKSSTGQNIKTSLGGVWLTRHLSITDHNPLQELATQLRDDTRVRESTVSGLYLAAIQLDIDRYTEPEVNLLQDSLMAVRALAYQTVRGLPGTAQIEDALHAHPDFAHAFLLTASIEARQARLRERIENDPYNVTRHDMLVVNDPVRFMETEQCMGEIVTKHFNATTIDTTDLGRQEVGQLCVTMINNSEVLGTR